MSDYANRTSELILLKNALHNDISTIFLLAGKACGITSFLKDKLPDELEDYDTFFFYINANNDMLLSSGLMNAIIKNEELYIIMQECFNHCYGEKNVNLMESISQDIPYIGNTVSFFFNKKTSLPIYTGNFASAIEEILTLFFQRLEKHHIVIAIDSAQNLLESSYGIIGDLIRFNNIKFIFAITEYNDNFTKLRNFINLKGFTNEEVNFCAPHASLIIELGKLFNRNIEFPQAEKILELTSSNIHKIIENITEPVKEYHLNTWAKAIVSVLNICSFSMLKNELYGIVKLCYLYSSNPKLTFNETLESLNATSIISRQGDLYQLRSLNHPEVVKLLNSYTDQIMYKRNVLA